MESESLSPVDVSELLLQKSGEALRSGDFDSFNDCFLLPQELTTYSGRKMIETSEDLRAVFDGVREHFLMNNITDLVRYCVAAEYRDANTVVATHMSRPTSGAIMVQAPYPVYSVLVRDAGTWKVAESHCAIENEPRHTKALSG